MFSGCEYAVFNDKILNTVEKGISTEKNEMFFVDLKKLRRIEGFPFFSLRFDNIIRLFIYMLFMWLKGYVQLVYNTMKETETKIYDRYYGSAREKCNKVYAWELGITEVIYSI